MEPVAIQNHSRESTERDAVTTIDRRTRWGLFALPLYGVLTLWATRNHQPDPSEDFRAYAEYVTTDAFLVDHLAGSIGGTVLALFGVTALFALLAGGRAARWATSGYIASMIGNALMLTIFGVAAFASPAIGRAYLDGQAGVSALNDDVYGAALGVTALTATLLYGAGAVLTGIALWRSGVAPRWTGLLYGLSAPLIGVAGLVVGAAQPVGAVLLTASTLWVAGQGLRRGAVPPAAQLVSAPPR